MSILDTKTMTPEQQDDARQIRELMKHPAYRDPSHSDHSHISQQVREYFEKDYPYPAGVDPLAPLDS